MRLHEVFSPTPRTHLAPCAMPLPYQLAEAPCARSSSRSWPCGPRCHFLFAPFLPELPAHVDLMTGIHTLVLVRSRKSSSRTLDSDGWFAASQSKLRLWARKTMDAYLNVRVRRGARAGAGRGEK